MSTSWLKMFSLGQACVAYVARLMTECSTLSPTKPSVRPLSAYTTLLKLFNPAVVAGGTGSLTGKREGVVGPLLQQSRSNAEAEG